MIRYATRDDASWLIATQEANPETVYHVISGEALERMIDSNCFIISEDDETGEPKSFVQFQVEPEHVRVFLLLTEAGARKRGHARQLYMYLYAKYKKPIKYSVEAGSESETIWTTHNEYVAETVKKTDTKTGTNGKTYHEYLTAGSGYVE